MIIIGIIYVFHWSFVHQVRWIFFFNSKEKKMLPNVHVYIMLWKVFFLLSYICFHAQFDFPQLSFPFQLDSLNSGALYRKNSKQTKKGKKMDKEKDRMCICKSNGQLIQYWLIDEHASTVSIRKQFILSIKGTFILIISCIKTMTATLNTRKKTRSFFFSLSCIGWTFRIPISVLLFYIFFRFNISCSMWEFFWYESAKNRWKALAPVNIFVSYDNSQ